jgi:hypothetical protein
MKSKIHAWRWIAGVLTAACLLPAGGCGLSEESLAALTDQVLTRQVANILSDTVFFLLDNALVRWTG